MQSIIDNLLTKSRERRVQHEKLLALQDEEAPPEAVNLADLALPAAKPTVIKERGAVDVPAGASDTPNARALLNPTRHARRELASKPHAGF